MKARCTGNQGVRHESGSLNVLLCWRIGPQEALTAKSVVVRSELAKELLILRRRIKHLRAKLMDFELHPELIPLLCRVPGESESAPPRLEVHETAAVYSKEAGTPLSSTRRKRKTHERV